MPGASAAQGDQEPAQEETAELMADVLPKLREAVKEAHPTDEEPPEEVLCKFLRGCKYNPEKAAKVGRLRAHSPPSHALTRCRGSVFL